MLIPLFTQFIKDRTKPICYFKKRKPFDVSEYRRFNLILGPLDHPPREAFGGPVL